MLSTLTPLTNPNLKVGSVWKLNVLRYVALVAIVLSALLVASGAGATSPSATTIGEANNAKVVVVAKGGHITVTLHSTYWTLNALAGQRVLRQIGTTRTLGVLPGASHGCAAGMGCGTVTAHFLATGSGVVHFRATRTTCGEAMHCSPSQSLWTVTIRVR